MRLSLIWSKVDRNQKRANIKWRGMGARRRLHCRLKAAISTDSFLTASLLRFFYCDIHLKYPCWLEPMAGRNAVCLLVSYSKDAHLLWLAVRRDVLWDDSLFPLIAPRCVDGCVGCSHLCSLLTRCVLCAGRIAQQGISRCHNCALHLSACLSVCQLAMSKWLRVQYACVIGAGSIGDERGKTIVRGLILPVCWWIMTAAGLSAAAVRLLACTGSGFLSPRCIYGSLLVYILTDPNQNNQNFLFGCHSVLLFSCSLDHLFKHAFWNQSMEYIRYTIWDKFNTSSGSYGNILAFIHVVMHNELRRENQNAGGRAFCTFGAAKQKITHKLLP